jgi:hypothetical protein
MWRGLRVALLCLSIHTGLLVGCSSYIPTVNVLFIALCGDVRFDAGQPDFGDSGGGQRHVSCAEGFRRACVWRLPVAQVVA